MRIIPTQRRYRARDPTAHFLDITGRHRSILRPDVADTVGREPWQYMDVEVKHRLLRGLTRRRDQIHALGVYSQAYRASRRQDRRRKRRGKPGIELKEVPH